MGRLDEKVAIVTGAGRGIGRAIAEELAREGATVVASDLDPTTAEDAGEVVGGLGIATDVSDRASVEAMVAQVRERYGRIDVLVNNAGYDEIGPFVDSDPDRWAKIIGVNLYGALYCCHAVVPVMAEQGGGAVVNLGSDAGRVGSSGEAVYSAAKGGIIAFTKTLARETARAGVRVNCVCPGPTDTALFNDAFVGKDKLREALIKAIPLRRLAQPTDLAPLVAFLASPDASYITGQTVSVSGGLSMA